MGSSLATGLVAFGRGGRTETVRVAPRLVANDVHPVLAVAEMSGCLAFLPDFCAPDGWREVLPEWSTPAHEVNALRTRSRGALPKVRLFVEALKEGFAAAAAGHRGAPGPAGGGPR